MAEGACYNLSIKAYTAVIWLAWFEGSLCFGIKHKGGENYGTQETKNKCLSQTKENNVPSLRGYAMVLWEVRPMERVYCVLRQDETSASNIGWSAVFVELLRTLRSGSCHFYK